MEPWKKLRNEEARESAVVTFKCYADSSLFDTDVQPTELQLAVLASTHLPCRRTGSVGYWCSSCVFCEVKDWRDVE
jgi:hypothetical protein